MHKPRERKAHEGLGIPQEFTVSAFDELRKALGMVEGITIEELSDILHTDRAGLNRIIKQYGSLFFKGATGTAKIFSGNFDLRESRIDYCKDFFPSRIARRSYLYLQALYDTTFSSRYFTVRENIPSYLLAQTMRGAGLLKYLDKKYEILPGDVFLLDCRRLHDYCTASAEGWGYRMAHFDGVSMPDFYAQILLCGNVKFHFADDSRFSELFTNLFELNRTSTPDREVLSHCVLTELITEILKTLPCFEVNELPERIKTICEWLQAHCCEKLTLDTISKQFNMSKYYMSREFKRCTGKTLFDFITDARIDTAKKLLRYTDLPVSIITDYAGFMDQSNFSRLFRLIEGVSPVAYRKQWNGI